MRLFKFVLTGILLLSPSFAQADTVDGGSSTIYMCGPNDFRSEPCTDTTVVPATDDKLHQLQQRNIDGCSAAPASNTSLTVLILLAVVIAGSLATNHRFRFRKEA